MQQTLRGTADALAQVELGVAYAHGEGVPCDLVRTCVWINLAAAKKSPAR